MAIVNIQNGIAVNLCFPGGIAITTPALSANLILQSAEESNGAENYRVYDEVGNRVVSAWFDPHKKITLELIVKAAGQAAVLAATAVVEAIVPGNILVCGSLQQMPGCVATNLEVMDSPKLAGTNKDAKKFTVNVEISANITGPVPA